MLVWLQHFTVVLRHTSFHYWHVSVQGTLPATPTVIWPLVGIPPSEHGRHSLRMQHLHQGHHCQAEAAVLAPHSPLRPFTPPMTRQTTATLPQVTLWGGLGWQQTLTLHPTHDEEMITSVKSPQLKIFSKASIYTFQNFSSTKTTQTIALDTVLFKMKKQNVSKNLWRKV